jgi:hypothetical protein
VTEKAEEPVIIDCEGCTARGAACGDCVVTALLGAPPDGIELDDAERRAIAVLAESGLVPPLRMTRRKLHRDRDPHVA